MPEPNFVEQLLDQALFIGMDASIDDAFIFYQMTLHWDNQFLADIVRSTIVAGQIARSSPDHEVPRLALVMRRRHL